MSGNIVLRADIEDMGSSRQISRCFKDLVEMGELIKIGYGIYTKASVSESINKPIIKDGFGLVCRELGVKSFDNP
ncbi:MAG: type IV toxin-antitoxin system AbiEi family antitoxin domain-containing protein [Legionella sp.]